MPSARYYVHTAMLLVGVLSGCGEESDKAGTSASGGEGDVPSSGGMSTSGGGPVTGGQAAVGGADAGRGGVLGSGGNVALGGGGGNGGTGTGGTGTGGTGTGGTGTGGASTGGMTTGGTGTGGTSTGGTGTGGTSTGGTSTGGTGIGGTSTGGTSTGGTSTGGASTGGASIGGEAGTSNGGEAGTGTGGEAGTGGAAGPIGPCDIYESVGTPCVAAHATVRALYAAYDGPLYQIQRASDQATTDVSVGDGGFADTSVQDSFCAGTSCTIPVIYDQSGNENHLRVVWWAYWLREGGNPADANGQRITVGGHTVYGIRVTGYSTDVGYRTGVQLPGTASITNGSTTVTFSEPQTLPANTPLFFRVNTQDCPPDSFPDNCKFLPQWTAADITNSTTVTLKSPYTGTSSSASDVWDNTTRGVATGDEAEAIYMVVDGRRYSDQCCFGYGNSEMSGWDEGNGTMECIYFGTDITWGGKGEGSGPWVAADLENGMFKCDQGGWRSEDLQVPSAKSIDADFVTAMVKGPSGNHFTLKAGNAQSGTLVTMWDGSRPPNGYSPKALRGAVILGTGGDGSNGGTGTWFEGVMTIGNPPDEVDELIQANIVAVGYGN